MLKLSKYEIKRNIIGLIILFIIITIIEVYFVISTLLENTTNTVISATLLYLASVISFFCIFIFGVVVYSKELSSKSSYLTFMTPRSSMSILCSKMFTTLIVGLFFLAIIILFAWGDIVLASNVYPEIGTVSSFIDEILLALRISKSTIVFNVLAWVISFLAGFFAVIATSYFAITLSSTLFQNRKFKGIISGLLFLLIIYIVISVGSLLPYAYDDVNSSYELIVNMLPDVIYSVIIMIGFLFTSSKLLDKRVSL